jgi:DNA-binding XRE family transcriptional regulator
MMAWLEKWRNYASTMRHYSGDHTGNTAPATVLRVPQSASALPGNLKRLRAQRGLTVAELSRAAVDRDGPVSRSTIRAIERGATNPTLNTALALAQALGVGVEVLVEDGP